MKLSSTAVLLSAVVLALPGASAATETSFLRRRANDAAPGCLNECVDVDEEIYIGKKKHPTKKEIFTKATVCASACLPATHRNAPTIACNTKCFKKQASDVVKAVDNAINKEINDCEKKCAKDDQGCEKKCEKKYKRGSRSKSVSKAVEKKVLKVAGSTKKCLGTCANI